MMAWCDVETTGLKPADGMILELGIIITDDALQETARCKWLLSWSGPDPKSMADKYVREMHEKNRLWFDWYTQKGFPLRADIADWIAKCGGEGAPLCGSSIHFDRAWLNYHLPSVASLFHYRNIDVSSLKETFRRFRADIYETRPKDRNIHRVWPDCEDSIAEYRHYLKALTQ